MRIFKTGVFVLLIAYTFNVFAKIIETNDMAIIRQETSTLGSDDLVAFDVVNVIFTPKDQILLDNHKKDYIAIINDLTKELGQEKTDILESIILLNCKQELVDREMPALIKSLQKNQVKVVALTSSKTGRFGKIASREDLRLQTLKNLEIDFRNGLTKSVLFLDDVEGVDKNHPPKFKNGVIFTSRKGKGVILKSFLNKVNFIPKKMVFIDNKLHKVKSVEAFCKEAGIEFVGIHFTKFYSFPRIPYNKDIAAKQFETLKSKNIWPSDAQAKCLLKNPKIFKTCFKR